MCLSVISSAAWTQSHDLTRKSNFQFHLFGLCVYNQASLLPRLPSSSLLWATSEMEISTGAWELQPLGLWNHLHYLWYCAHTCTDTHTHTHTHTCTHTHTHRSYQAVPAWCGLGRDGLSGGGHPPWHLRRAPFNCAVSEQHLCWWCCGHHHSPGEVGLLA